MKKLLSLVLAAATMLCLCAPAFADEQNMNITATTNVPTMKVVVPKNPKITFNPYGLDVTVGEDTVSDVIIADPMVVENQSNVPVKVAIKVTGTVKGHAAFATSAPTSTDTKNSVYLLLTAAVVKDKAAAEGLVAGTAGADGVHVVSTTAKEVKGFEAKADASVKNVLAKGTGTAAATEGGFMGLLFSGSCTEKPAQDWAKTDIIGANVAFTFTPLRPSATDGFDWTP